MENIRMVIGKMGLSERRGRSITHICNEVIDRRPPPARQAFY
ncbi:hypothetical protein [Lacicoccus alkaliphilus]|nr:hypothetical protein [Salinicoccus alkaliphilus]